MSTTPRDLVASLLALRSPRAVRLAQALLVASVVATAVLAVLAGVAGGLTGVLAALTLATVLAALAVLLRLLQVVGRREAAAPAVTPDADLLAQVVALQQEVRGVKQTTLRTARRLRAAHQLATRRDVRQSAQRVMDQVQASQLLLSRVDLPASLPPLGRFTASADFLGVLVDLLLRERPRTVVESGSGVSTLVLALAARQHDVDCRIVALEHDPTYAARTRELLAAHGVGERAEVRLAPLEATGLPGHLTPWYSRDALGDLTDVGLVVVDGPPKATGPDVRYPMLPLLVDALAPDCLVVADDTGRTEDAAIVERWQAEIPGFDLVDLELEKGALLLRRRAAP